MIDRSIIQNYYNHMRIDEYHANKSWEHCYLFFKNYTNSSNRYKLKNMDLACLNLAYYLANFKMFSNSFLHYKDYKIHKYLINNIVMNKNYNYFLVNNRSVIKDPKALMKLVNEVKDSYMNNISTINGISVDINVSDSLATKIILGIYGCVPTYNEGFIRGLKMHNIEVGELSLESIVNIHEFYKSNETCFNKIKIKSYDEEFYYPPMKLLDIYFGYLGFDKDKNYSMLEEDKKIHSIIASKQKQNNSKNVQPQISKTSEIREYIVRKLEKAQQEGKEYFEIVSGELSKEIGLFNRMPMICNAMTSLENNIKYDILYNPPKGNGATKRIRYYLHNNKPVNENGNDKKAINYNLPNSLRGRNINENIIPTVCNLKNMLNKLVQYHGDFSKLKQWEKRSYKAYNIEDIKSQIIYSPETEWVKIIRKHILDGTPSNFGASCIDIYLVAYVSETYGKGKDKFFEYVKINNISDKPNSAQAIWQVGKGDGVYLDILNDDGTIKDWNFIKEWTKTK